MREIFRDLQRFRRALNTAFKQTCCVACGGVDLDPRQALVLKSLAELGPSSAVDLCQAILCDPATVNRTVADSVKRGWVRQVKDSRDRRRCRLTLTASGVELARRVLGRYRLLEKKTLEPFNPEERRRFRRDLERLTEHLNAA